MVHEPNIAAWLLQGYYCWEAKHPKFGCVVLWSWVNNCLPHLEIFYPLFLSKNQKIHTSIIPGCDDTHRLFNKCRRNQSFLLIFLCCDPQPVTVDYMINNKYISLLKTTVKEMHGKKQRIINRKSPRQRQSKTVLFKSNDCPVMVNNFC